MSRVNTSFILVLAFSSICFGATLMQLSMKNEKIITSTEIFDDDCQYMFEKEQENIKQRVANRLYQKALTQTFNGNAKEAQTISRCASLLFSGQEHWKIEPKDLL